MSKTQVKEKAVIVHDDELNEVYVTLSDGREVIIAAPKPVKFLMLGNWLENTSLAIRKKI